MNNRIDANDEYKLLVQELDKVSTNIKDDMGVEKIRKIVSH